ncbi:MAG: ATP-binding protein [Pseudomonadales bacterium]
MRSVQQRMLIITFTLFVSAWAVTVISTYFSLKHVAELSHDDDLKNYAHVIRGFAHRLIMQSGENTAEKRIEDELAAQYDISLAFNIVHKNNVVAKSIGAPNFPLVDEVSVRDVALESEGQIHDWRVYYYFDESDEIWIIVAETRESINALLFSVIFQAIWPNMVFLPLMLVAIFLGVRHSLKPLKELAGQVETQTPQFLNPISVGEVPQEVEPLVRSLNYMLRRLKEAFDNEHVFTANAAHELRTPLGALKTEAQILRQLEMPDAAKRAARRMEVRVDRASHLVSQLLTLSRMEANDLLENPALVNLDDIVSEVVTELSGSAKDKDVSISYLCDEAFRVKGEPISLGILARNLIDNAIRYSPPGTGVVVKLSSEDGRVCLSVVDEGPGIPKENMGDIFKKFYRMSSSTATGVGLGLSIVQRIAVLHAAEIHVSTGDSGTGLKIRVEFQRSLDVA